MKNELTVAICTYNCEHTIVETLTCIINQTLQNFDLLIVNDCSTDNTVQLIEDFLKNKNRKFVLINFDKNKGIANARQVALLTATTKYHVFIDADDLPHATLVEKEYKLISSNDSIIAVSSWSRFIDNKGSRIRGGIFMGANTKEEFMNLASNEKLIFLPVQTLFNREIALKVGGYRLDGFPEGKPRYQDFCEDLDLWTRMSDLYKEGKYILTIPEVLYSYRKGNEGISSNAIAMSLKMKFIKKNLKLRRANQNELTFIQFKNTVSENEMLELEKNAKAGYYLRNGFFLLKEYKISKGVFYICKSIFMNPIQFYQKVISNSGILK